MEETYLVDFWDPGDTADESVENMTAQGLVRVSEDAWFIDAAKIKCAAVDGERGKQAQYLDMMLTCSESFHMGFEEEIFAVDVFFHPQTYGYLLRHAEAGVYANIDGNIWSANSTSHFARVMGEWADQQRLSDDSSPVLIFPEDIIAIPNNWFQAPFTVLNTLTVLDLTVNGNIRNVFIFQWIVWPIVPICDMTDPECDAARMLHVLIEAARNTFPAQAAASLRLAIATLLAVPLTSDLPYQLVTYEQPIQARIAYIELLSRWYSAAARVHVVRDLFSTFLGHCLTLKGWLLDVPSRYAVCIQLLKAVLSVDDPTAENILLLDGRMDQYAGDWSEAKTPAENVEYLLEAIARRLTRSAGNSSSVDANDRSTLPDAQAAVTLALETELFDHIENNGSTMDAISLIMHSGAQKAIRYMLGKGASSRDLSTRLSTKIATFITLKEEYLIDSIKHDDAGNIDSELTDLTYATPSATNHVKRLTAPSSRSNSNTLAGYALPLK